MSGGELARDELALRVDDAQPLEARALGGDPGSGERHHAALPLLFVLRAVEVEIVERGARDRRRLAHARAHDGKDARFEAKRPVTAASSESVAHRRGEPYRSALPGAAAAGGIRSRVARDEGQRGAYAGRTTGFTAGSASPS